MSFTIYTIPLLISSLFLCGIAVWAWYVPGTKTARYLALLLFSCAIYSVGYALEISAARLDEVLFWIRFEYVGISVLPAFLVLFALHYTYPEIQLSRKIQACFFIIPVLTFLLVFTSEYHSLYYMNPTLTFTGPFPTIVFEKGVWYLVNSVFIFFAVLISNILFGMLLLKTSKAYRTQTVLLLIGTLIPWFAFIFYIVRILPWELDLSPYALTLSGLFIFWGIIHHQLLDLLPVARSELFEKLPDGVIVIDNQLRIADANEAARSYLMVAGSLIGRPAADVIPAWDQLHTSYIESAQKVILEIKRSFGSDSGRNSWVEVSLFAIKEQSPIDTGRMILLRDITDRKHAEEKLQLLATTDDLTGLWNRRYLMATLKRELQRAVRYNNIFSLVMLDIDHFKVINDTYGHAAGDEVLRQIAVLLKSRLRKTDIAGRIGGEEFCLLLPEASLEAAVQLANSLRESIAQTPIFYLGQLIFVTVSMGVTTYREGSDTDRILKLADDALYEAKNNGRNSIIIKADQ